MWILDSGTIDNKYKCPARLLVVDLINDTIINTLEIERDLYKGHLANFVVYHPKDSCTYPTIVMSDADGGAMVIHDGKQFCRFESQQFDADPEAATYTIDGESITQQYGILAMSVSDRTNHQLEEAQPIIHFRALSSHYIYWTYLSSIASYCDTKSEPVILQFEYRVPTQSVVFTVANRILFYGGIDTTSLNCYNTLKYLNEKSDVIIIFTINCL